LRVRVPRNLVDNERSVFVEFHPPPKVREKDGWPPNHPYSAFAI